MPKLKTIFFGTPDFSIACFDETLKNSTLIAAVTQPDRPRGRGQKELPCPIKERAIKSGVPVFSPASLKKDSLELMQLKNFLSQHSVDLLVVVAYGNLLPKSFLELPNCGAINVHASLLPKWRGAAPIQRILEADDSVSGISIQKMREALDAGPILAEAQIKILPTHNAKNLSEELSTLGAKLLGTLLEKASHSNDLSEFFTGQEQDEALATYASKIQKSEGCWSELWTAKKLKNTMRAFSVWPGVRAEIEGLGISIKFIEPGEVTLDLKLSPGELLLQGKKVYIGQSDGCLELKTLQLAGKRAMEAFLVVQELERMIKEAGHKKLRVIGSKSEQNS